MCALLLLLLWNYCRRNRLHATFGFMSTVLMVFSRWIMPFMFPRLTHAYVYFTWPVTVSSKFLYRANSKFFWQFCLVCLLHRVFLLEDFYIIRISMMKYFFNAFNELFSSKQFQKIWRANFLYKRVMVNEALQLYYKVNKAQVFSCEFWEIFKNIFS